MTTTTVVLIVCIPLGWCLGVAAYPALDWLLAWFYWRKHPVDREAAIRAKASNYTSGAGRSSTGSVSG
jgi:hypothetical protein